PTSKFNVRRYLRQGDPLSPFLFIIIMEGLYVAISDSIHSGLVRGINIGSSNITLSHLFFADDVVITTEWSSHDIDNIIRVLHVFYLASGLKINIRKSNIYGIGVSPKDVHLMASNMGCVAASFPFTYLGLPIGCNMSLIPSFGVVPGFQKISLLKWPNIVASFEKGGLNIGSLKSFNLALLQKWRWRMFSNPNALWVRVIKAFHGLEVSSQRTSFIFKWVVVHLFAFGKTLARFLNAYFQVQQIVSHGARQGLSDHGSQVNVQVDNDKCTRSLDDDGTFTVGALRRLIDDHLLPSLDTTTTWVKYLPRKVNIFMWRLKLDKLPHRLNLSLRVAKGIWRIVRRWCDNSFPIFESKVRWLDWWSSWSVSREKKDRAYFFFLA
nr:RNA-directed DNA polymerase, eukaryota [Tanacetum cinerariifolium]